jgi:hypothetical protein
MNIAWFTPFAKASAIGRFSRLVTAEIAKSNDVDIWYPEAKEIHETRLRTVGIPSGAQFGPETLAPYDLVVYNIGDHLQYHRHLVDLTSSTGHHYPSRLRDASFFRRLLSYGPKQPAGVSGGDGPPIWRGGAGCN